MKKILFISALLIHFGIIANAQTTLFSQNFDAGGVYGDYVDPTSDNKFTNIYTQNSTTSIPSITNNALRLVKTAAASGGTNAFYAYRGSGFGSNNIDLVQYKFDYTVSNITIVTGSPNVNFLVGSQVGDDINVANYHSRVLIAYNSTAGKWGINNGLSGPAYSGTQTITFVVNNSGGLKSYIAPDGTTATVGDDKFDIWVGNTIEVNDGAAAAANAGDALSKFKFIIAANTLAATFDIDNITIKSLDAFAPNFTASYPKANNINGTSFDLISNINEIGTTYYVIVPAGATAPTSAQVLAGTDANNTAAGFSGSLANTAANTDYTTSITGLALNTSYDVYVVAKDALNNLQASPVKLTVTTPNTLPITLTSFTAKAVDKSVLLNWNTASELNNDYFEVQHSADGKSFTTFGKINGAGTSKVAKDYSFNDENPFAGTNYYKLVQHDFDGKTSESKVISVDSKIVASQLSVYATTSDVKITLSSPNKTKGKLQLFDVSGRKFSEISVEVNKGYNTFSLPSTLQNGIYFIRYTTESEIINHKFLN